MAAMSRYTTLDFENLVDALFEQAAPYPHQCCLNASAALVSGILIDFEPNHELLDRALSNFEASVRQQVMEAWRERAH